MILSIAGLDYNNRRLLFIKFICEELFMKTYNTVDISKRADIYTWRGPIQSSIHVLFLLSFQHHGS